MKTLLKLSFLAFAILIGINAGAQSATSTMYSYNGIERGLRFGIKAGVNISGFTGDNTESLRVSSDQTGFNVGIFMEYTSSSNLYFLTGLDYTTKTEEVYLQLPIHIGYKIGLTDNINLGYHLGPYLAQSLTGGDLDLGLGLGMDLYISKFRIGMGYDWGLTDTYYTYNNGEESGFKNRNFSINIGYTF
ncbi:MAG: outer membrane beta-barrel protein [Dysgonomonas sp.]